ncbi:extracellular matrix glycoprotein pherophorin-V23 [Volvox carteri f. nagariensis]|uniref:Extracellular matrix glycoprotein pherophorin-V23 n=1 Tax=Volvox carteri f. nagariensis TaxID=3068 RepID=D8U543_VOLCA|nr:extracellular matrix glycoprotein pherophorin-V23 [Volvox carteri f. nagariensis]EFJ45152.1 extracellular matrix glycoprotein pherophorin-V23 [Volvox carteri f. nagariensis]|eukprot:XP_002953828.1 extracellular matrix glycoprotein pherophorin-V23 [Volvox carteri f. nagariensis]
MQVAGALTLVLLASLGHLLLAADLVGLFPDFPFCECDSNGAYDVVNPYKYRGNNTYCFTIRVLRRPGCTSYCCTQADLKKLEINTYSSCDVPGVLLSATLNGAPTVVRPNFEAAPQGAVGDTILKLTRLGLNLTTADGAEICITLRTNRAGKGCTNLEQLCVPPPLSVMDLPVVFSECQTCVNLKIYPDERPGIIPFVITPELCENYSSTVISRMTAASQMVGAFISNPLELKVCNKDTIIICGAFKTVDPGNSAVPVFLSNTGNELATHFLNTLIPEECPAYLNHHTIEVTIDGLLSIPPLIDDNGIAGMPNTCISGLATENCELDVLFPNCTCLMTTGLTPFGALPTFTTKPGRTPASTQYCFRLWTFEPYPGPCADAASVTKVEFWVNDTMRRNINGFAVKSSSDATYTYIYPTWAPRGDNVVRATPLNWSLQQANGAEVCMDLDNDTTPDEFCLGPWSRTCHLSIFDDSRSATCAVSLLAARSDACVECSENGRACRRLRNLSSHAKLYFQECRLQQREEI